VAGADNSVSFEPLQALFDDGSPVTKELLKDTIYTDMKYTRLAGVPDFLVRTNFNPSEGSDILIEKVDPEKALGYNVFSSAQEYSEHLQASQYVPTDADLGGIDG
jgi:hypothetical protein